MPYLHNETKRGICIKIEFNPQKNISLLQHGRRFFVYSSNMAAVMSCEHTLRPRVCDSKTIAEFGGLIYFFVLDNTSWLKGLKLLGWRVMAKIGL